MHIYILYTLQPAGICLLKQSNIIITNSNISIPSAPLFCLNSSCNCFKLCAVSRVVTSNSLFTIIIYEI